MQDDAPLSDESLVSLIRTHDRERYSDLVKRYQEKLMRYATYLLGDEQAAGDVVQESFIKAYINLNGFNTRKKFSSWIYRIVHNEAMNAAKKHKKESAFPEGFEVLSDENIELEFSKKELIRQIHACLNGLPIMYREPLALFYLEDKSYDDISDILRIPPGTVAIRMNRAKKLMKTLCQKNT